MKLIFCKDCRHLSSGPTSFTDPNLIYYCYHPDNMENVNTFLEEVRKCKMMAKDKNYDNKCRDFKEAGCAVVGPLNKKEWANSI